jgi:hypothetical protein
MSLSNESNDDLHLKEIIEYALVQFDKFSKLILAQRSLSTIKRQLWKDSTFN